ncbi:MAG: hypothetical protein SFY56_06025 [Bacteroidota bacterium]|nr:hypothetical protein [Bacteroidota bacterium]
MKKLYLFFAMLLVASFVKAQQFNLNDRIEAEDKGKWYKATIIINKGQYYKDGKYFIHWDGYSASYDIWIEEAKVRKPVVPTQNTVQTNTPSAPPVEAKFKMGDKVTYLDDHFCDGTIIGYKNGYYLVDFPDQWLNAQGKQGVDERSLMPQWTYKAFYNEIEALRKEASKHRNTCTIDDIARLICDDCSTGNKNKERNQDFVDNAKIDMKNLQALVKKYEPLPDNGNKWYFLNPSKVGQIAKECDKMISEISSWALKSRVQRWFDADMYFYDFTYAENSTDHVLFNGKSFADFAVCGSLTDLKEGLKKNLEEAIKKNGFTGTPDDYLKGFDENFEKRKAKLIEEANENGWVKSDYPYTDNSMNALVANSNLKTVNTYFNVQSFQVKKDDLGYITEQTKGGVVIYQKPGCTYWMWQYVTIYKSYLKNGTYGPAKARLMDYGFIKPF